MTSDFAAPVVAGVDGSGLSAAAVELAAWEADRRHRPLRLVHGFVQPAPFGVAVAGGYDVATPLRQARYQLAVIAERVAERYPDLPITRAVVAGEPAGVLIEASRSATLLVVGCRGLGGLTGLLAGSVSSHLVGHAHAPVIVVRPPSEPPPAQPAPGPVVVGLDGSPATQTTLDFAFDEADARHERLVAVHAWGRPAPESLLPGREYEYRPQPAEAEADRMLAELLAGWSEKYPDVTVVRTPVHSFGPAATLSELTRGAGLVVVGSGGHHGGVRTGGIGRSLIHHAHAPVAVVPAEPYGGAR